MSDWETVGSSNDGWEDVGGWETVSPKKRDTTLSEDFGIGMANVASPLIKFGGLVAGAGAGLVGADETQDKIYKGMEDTLKSTQDYWIPKDAEQQTFGGKATSAISTLPMQLLSFPFSPADTGKTAVDAGEDGSWGGAAGGAVALDTLGNLAGVALPGGMGGSLLKKFASGAAINAAQETYIKKAIQNSLETEKGKKAFEPTWEGAALAGIVGGPMGMATPSRKGTEPTAKPPIPEVDKVDPSIKADGLTASNGELVLLNRAYNSSLDKLSNIEKAMTEVNDAIASAEGDIPSHILDTFKELEDQHRQLSDKITSMEDILADPTQIPESHFTANKILRSDIVNQRKARQKAARGPYQEPTARTLEDIEAREARENGEINTQKDSITSDGDTHTVEVGGKDPHTIVYTLGSDGRVKRKITYPDGTGREDFLVKTKDGDEMFVTSEEYSKREFYPQTLTSDQLKTRLSHEHETTQPTPKTKVSTEAPRSSPVEIALSRVGEAMSMSPEALGRRLDRAREVLDNLPQRTEQDVPGSSHDARREALTQEIKVYESLQRGEQPDLGWFEGKQEVPMLPIETPISKVAGPERFEPLEELTRQETLPDNGLPPIDVYGDVPVNTPWQNRRNGETGATRSPAQQLQHHQFNFNKLSRILENVNKQIAAYDEGRTPSGTFDVAKAMAMRESLEKQIAMHDEGIAKVLDLNPQLREKLNKVVGKPAAEPPNVPKEKFTSIAEATKTVGQTDSLEPFLNNMNLFSSIKKSDIHFDSTIPVELQRVLRKMFTTLGLGKEKVFVVDTTFNQTGFVFHVGNTTVISLNRTALVERYGKGAFGDLRVASHEMGHFLFNKYLKETITHLQDLGKLDAAFKDYIAKNKIEPIFTNDSASVLKTQVAFHEFFAERTARALMYHHVLDKFAPKSKYLVALSKMLSDSYRKLSGKFNLTKQNFVDEIVSTIITRNRESIAQTGKTLFEKIQLERNDKAILANHDPDAYPFAKATLQDVSNKVDDLGWYLPRKDKTKPVEFDVNQTTAISRRAIDALGHGLHHLAGKMFGKTGLAQIFKDNPVIQDVYWKIREAEINSSKTSNNLWFGDVGRQVWDKSNFFAKMSKIKDKASAYMVVKTSKPEDMAAVHDMFKRGFEERLDHQETLDKYGTQLSEEQKGIFTSLSTLFNKQYEAIVKAQGDMGKKNILPRRKGWYPSVRKGDYFVDVNFQGASAYRQHFSTKAEGEAFLQKIGTGNLKHLSTTGVEKIKVEDSNPFLDGIETIKDFLEMKYPPASGVLKKDIEGLVTSLITKGGKLGKHHVQRSNLEGYKGSEIFLDVKDRGNSFKEAIQSSVGDFTGSLRKMQINHSVEPLLRNGKDQMSPDTYAAVQQMTDSALNRVENKAQVLDDWVRNFVDARAKDVYDILGKEFKPGDPIFDKVKNAVLETFYLTKLMAKPVFAVGQVLGTPVQAIRHMAYDGGLRAYLSFGKGMLSLATNNKDLKDSMFRVSQTTNVFEPQFIEALHLNKNDSSFIEGIKKYLFLNKVNEGADSFSRVLTYAGMYEHYKSLGKSKAEAEKLAMHGTDTTMVQYGRSEQAPVFQHTGIVGEMVRPLQTFGQAQLANLIGDIRHFQTLKPSTWAPLLTYGLTATLIGGALSPQFITEYEILRKWLANAYPDYALPSILDLVARDGSMMDRILPDSDAARKALLYGLPSLSGLDLASSVRSNETFATLVSSVILAEESYAKMFPLLSFGADVATGSATILSQALGKQHTDAELTKAINKASPVGPIAYGTKELFGVNETNIMGENTGMLPLGNTGTASKTREPIDIAAGLMGTRSVDDRFETQKALQRTEIDKNRQAQIKRLADLAIETGDQKYIEKIVSYGIEGNALKAMIGSELWSRLADSETRYLINSKGKVPSNYESGRKASLLNKFRSQE